MRIAQKRLTAATGLTIGVYGMQATLLGSLLPELSKSITPGQSGTLAAVQSAGLILASLVTGPVLDRAGRRAGALGGLGLVAGALTLLPRANTYAPLLAAMCLLGLGGGVISTATNTLASDLGGKRQAGMMNLLNVFFGLGGMATPALAAFLDKRIVCGVIVALAAGTMVLYTTAPMPQRTGAGKGSLPEVRQLLFRPLFPLLCLYLFLYVSAELGVWNWLAAWWTAQGVPQAVALRTLSFGFATGIIAGRLAVLRVLLRFRPATVTLACSVLMLVSTSLVLRASGTVAAGVAVFCAGLAMAPVYPTTLALVGEAFPRGTATAIGIAVTVGWIGVAVSSKVIGSIAGDDPGRLGMALLTIPIASAIMVALGVAIRRLAGRG